MSRMAWITLAAVTDRSAVAMKRIQGAHVRAVDQVDRRRVQRAQEGDPLLARHAGGAAALGRP